MNLDMSSAYHTQSDGQTKVVNRSLGKLLRCLVGDTIKSWYSKLPQAEFAHNHACNHSSGFSTFQVMYCISPRIPVDLSPLPDRTRIHRGAADFVEDITRIHAIAKSNLEASAMKYKTAIDSHQHHLFFEIGNLVWAVFTKAHMPSYAYNKLKAKKIGHFEVLERINDNAYLLAFLMVSTPLRF